jgi:hypothetical protein
MKNLAQEAVVTIFSFGVMTLPDLSLEELSHQAWNPLIKDKGYVSEY